MWRCLAAVIAVVACSDREAPRPATGSGSGSGSAAVMPRVRHYAPPDRVAIDSPPIVLPKQESFRVLGKGKGKRAQLRYQPLAGMIEHHLETRLVSRQLEGGTIGKPVTLPAIHDGFHVQPIANKPPLFRPLAATITGTTTPLAEQYVAPWRQKLQDRRISIALDARGQLGTVIFNDDPGMLRSGQALDELVQRLLAIAIPVPAEPVAPGAKWEVVTVLRQGPIYVKQTATYTLVARTKAAWQLHVKLLRVGEEQRVNDPTLPKGVTADLLALFRLLEGDVEVDPRYPLLARGSYTIESRLHAKLQVPGQPAVEQLSEDTGTVTFTTAPPAP
ncbi:MAG: hypothetical protein WKG01_07010 [Kofleriaceae bacterium]